MTCTQEMNAVVFLELNKVSKEAKGYYRYYHYHYKYFFVYIWGLTLKCCAWAVSQMNMNMWHISHWYVKHSIQGLLLISAQKKFLPIFTKWHQWCVNKPSWSGPVIPALVLLMLSQRKFWAIQIKNNGVIECLPKVWIIF